MTVLQMIQQLQATPGTNDRIALFASLASKSSTLTSTFIYALTPGKNYHIKKIPEYTPTSEPLFDLDCALTLLDSLVEREYTGNAAREYLANILGSLTSDDAKVIEMIISGEFTCGLQASNVNKALGYELIAETPYMRCDVGTNEKLRKLVWKANPDGSANVYSEIKADGQYLNHKILNGVWGSESRAGKEYDFLGYAQKEFEALGKILETDFNVPNPVLNGEAVIVKNGKILPRKTGNGIIQKFGKDTGTIEETDGLTFILWDVLPHAAYKAGVWNVPRKFRREMLDAAIKKMNSPIIQMVKFKPVFSIAEAVAYNTEVMENAEEGTVVKDESGVWKDGTSTKQLKMKLEITVDLRIVGFEEGTNKNKGSCGSILAESSCGMLKVRIGSGLLEKADKSGNMDLVRKHIWDNKDKYMGVVIQTKANDIVTNKTNNITSLSHPRADEIRWDKNACDDLARIYDIRDLAVSMGATTKKKKK